MTTSIATSPDTAELHARKTSAEAVPSADGMNARDRVRQLYRQGKERAVEVEEGFEDYVRAHPIRSVLVAGGVGLAVGFLFGRRR
jgi:ElaB/YqjD/DUF883 family membrane-anchored ribosome-binding protein